jgi:hypothetical protein
VTSRIAALIVNEGTWLPIAMATALVTIVVLHVKCRHTTPSRPLIMSMMSLFAGVTLAIMGAGHLLAVATKQAQGTLEGSPWLLYPIGIAVLVPSALIVRHTRALLAANDAPRRTVGLNAWLAGTLVVLGVFNIPLAIPVLLNIGYRLHVRRAAGVAIVGAAILIQAGLLVGGLIFMASGQNFEQFSGME